MQCLICNTKDKEDFSLYESKHFCDDCTSIMDYWFENVRRELSDRYTEVNNSELWECEFLEGLERYVEEQIEKYNNEIRK